MDTDYFEMPLKDYGLDSKWSFFSKFINSGITTVGHILNDDLIEEVMENTSKKVIRDEILGFIDLVKYKVFNLSLTCDVLLDEKAKYIDDIFSSDCLVNFSRMGFVHSDDSEFSKLQTLYDKFKLVHGDFDTKEYTILDVFRFQTEGNVEESEFDRKIKMYIDSYDNSYGSDRNIEFIRRDLVYFQERIYQLENYTKLIEKRIALLERGENANDG